MTPPPRASRPRTRPAQDRLGVLDAHRLLESSQLARQAYFQALVRRFLSQILYGCTTTDCTTPTCLSCSKRLVSKPFRPPTQLTARALAFYLASQPNPSRRLCPHKLNVHPDTLEMDGADGLCTVDESPSHVAACTVCPRPETLHPSAHSTEHTAHEKRIVDALEHRRQSRKDPKSLGQNLYDTFTMIVAYSKHIPTPSSVFSSLAFSSPPDRQLPDPPPPHVPAAVVGATPPAVHVRHRPEAETPQGRFGTRPSNATSADIISETLGNGERVHKTWHVPNGHQNGLQSCKPSKSTLLHGTLDGTLDGDIAGKLRLGMTRPRPSMPAKSTPRVSLPRSSVDKRHLSVQVPQDAPHPTVPVASHLTCDIVDQLKDDVYHHRTDPSRDLNFVVDYDPNRRFRPAKPFVNRSLYYTLSDPETLLRSFRDQNSQDYKDSPLPHLDAHRLTHAFRDWTQRNGALVFDSLYEAVEALFRPPPELETIKSPRLKPSRKDATPSHASPQSTAPGRYLADTEAAHIVMICIHALTALVPVGWPHTWVQIRKLRGWGVVVPGAPPEIAQVHGFAHPWLEMVDHLEYEPAVRLAARLLKGIGTRRCYEHVLATIHARDEPHGPSESSAHVDRLLAVLLNHLAHVEKAAVRRKEKMNSTQNTDQDPGWTVTATFVEWLRTIIVKQWDGNVVINKWGSVGTAVAILTRLHAEMRTFNLRSSMFLIPYFNENIDSFQAPLGFLKYKNGPNTFHILQHAVFFPEEALVGFFRTINFNRMLKQFQKSARITNFQSRWDQIVSNPRHWNVVMDRLGVAITEYLVLDVSRQNPLEETLDQLWGQEKRKLLKPLKVRIGVLDGEVGLDQGGVTYEFFRLVLGEAFKPDTGMFTVDAQTGMTWFQPASLEPPWKFEMVGVLFSLAVYNGITLPVTFPLALYNYFLQQDSTGRTARPVDYIADGWPMLAKSFREFLDFPGEVADVFMRDYTFSFEAFGQNIDVDMQAFKGRKWPDFTPKSSSRTPNLEMALYPDLDDLSWRRPRGIQSSRDPPTVTTAVREQYVADYVEWLVHASIRPQLEAFARGFHTCLHPASLSFFTPSTLRSLVEGSPSISIPLLREHSVRYELPYSAAHPTIRDFWAVVEKYDEEEKKRLLEFVTANERIPVTGYESVKFDIVRVSGDTEALPTSSTCFGKLWLPQYAGREKLRNKLGVAIRNSEGFGIV